MSEVNDAAVTAEATGLKSTDTSTFKPDAKPEPVEAKAEKVETQETPSEGDADAPAADSQRKEQRLPRWMKERLERERQVTAARTRAEVEREFSERQVRPADPVKDEQPREKTLEDFDYDMSAYAKHLARQEIEAEKQRERHEAEQREQAAAAEQFKSKIDAFEARVGAGAWEDIETSPLNTDAKFKPLVDLFVGDDLAFDIAHHLAQNLSEAERLLSLPPIQRVREVSKLAEQFDGEAQDKPKPPLPPKKLTNAPPPAKLVAGGGKPAVNVDDPNISTADRIAAWRAQRTR